MKSKTKIMDTKIKRSIQIGGILIAILMLTTGSVSACTGFTSSDEETVLVGTNFDWSHSFNVYIHFFPGEEGKYGRVTFELQHSLGEDEDFGPDPDWIVPKQGMNDQGLFYDVYLAPYVVPVNSSDKPIFTSDDPDYYRFALWAYCLAKCATVSEVLDIFDQYNLLAIAELQCFFVDKNGDSVIIEGDEIFFKEGNYQVVTNFYRSQWQPPYPCWRYNTAVDMLESMTELSVDYFSSICNATQQTTTVHSNVYNLLEETIRVYYYKDFEKSLVFDLNEELAKGERRIHLGSLFEPEDNQPPEKPEAPTGPESGNVSTEYKYFCKEASDPDGDRTMCLFDWGDGTMSNWIAPPRIGKISAEHNYTERGSYEIKVKAMDVYGRESEWSDPLSVSMPKNKIINISPLILQFLENYPHLFSLLRQILLFLG